MTMRPTDRIIGPSRGSAPEAIAYALANGAARFGEVTSYINECYRLGPLVGIDPAICVSQSSHETDIWRSSWWVNRLNPAGIGITGDPAQNAQSHTWTNGTASAQSHLSHLLVYALGPVEAGWVWSQETGQSIKTVDVRYDAYVDAYGNTAQAQTIQELSGTWAVDKAYAAGVCRHGNALFANIPDQGAPPVSDIAYGKVPHPTYQDRIIPNSQNSAWDNLGTRTVRAVVWHRMLGSLAGTDGYFRGEGGSRALTDYGVGVLAQDGANLDGVIYRWNDPQGSRSPWANGSVSAPYGDGLAFVNRFGVNGVNRDATAIEISGFEQTALSPKSRAAICGITAYWADQAHVPWDKFPAVPGENRSFVIWHQEFTIGTGKQCPFALVMNETNALIEQTRAILKKYQITSDEDPPKPPKYADPVVPDWMSDDLKNGYPTDHKWNGIEVFAVLRTYEATKKTKRLQKPDHTGPVVGPAIEVRERFRANYRAVVKDAKGVNRGYVLTPYGTWIQDSALTPRVAIRKA